MRLLGLRREKAGNRSGAEQSYRQAADHDDIDALRLTAQLRDRSGDHAGAEQLYWQAADLGDFSSLWHLSAVLFTGPDEPDFKHLRRFGLNDDGSLAAPW